MIKIVVPDQAKNKALLKAYYLRKDRHITHDTLKTCIEQHNCSNKLTCTIYNNLGCHFLKEFRKDSFHLLAEIRLACKESKGLDQWLMKYCNTYVPYIIFNANSNNDKEIKFIVNHDSKAAMDLYMQGCFYEKVKFKNGRTYEAMTYYFEGTQVYEKKNSRVLKFKQREKINPYMKL